MQLSAIEQRELSIDERLQRWRRVGWVSFWCAVAICAFVLGRDTAPGPSAMQPGGLTAENVQESLKTGGPFDETGDGYDDRWRYQLQAGYPCAVGPGPTGRTEIVDAKTVCDQLIPNGSGRHYA